MCFQFSSSKQLSFKSHGLEDAKALNTEQSTPAANDTRHIGRPQFHSILTDVKDNTPAGKRVAVIAAGPARLVSAVKTSCMTVGLPFEEASFDL